MKPHSHNRSSENQRAYRLYTTFKSTAWILPVLYLFLTKNLHLTSANILLIAGFYTLVPFMLELPLGILADRLGTRFILLMGLVFQALSCVALLVFRVDAGYHLYLLLIYVAAASYSGADQSFLRDLFSADEDDKFKFFMQENNGLFYRNSIFMLILGAILYQVSDSLPFVIQIGSFAVSGWFLLKIPIKELHRSNKRSVLSDSYQAAQVILSDRKFLALIVISSVFDSALLLNNKVIQQQFAAVLPTTFLGVIGITYALGNVVSYQASRLFRRYHVKFESPTAQIIIAGALMYVGYTLLSFSFGATIIMGFFVLSGFKSIYRPIVDSEMTIRIPFSYLRATTLSVVSLVSSVMVALFHIFLSRYYEIDIVTGNVYFVILSAPLIVISIIAYQRFSGLRLRFGESVLTGKSRFILRADSTKEFQVLSLYPNEIREDHFENVLTVTDSAPYPCFRHELAGGRGIATRYLGSTHLHELKPAQQFDNCRLLLSRPSCSAAQIHLAQIPKIPDVFPEVHLQLAIFQLGDWGVIHGDLHPDNIMIFESKPYVIDWDLSGLGPKWFDVLTLLSSPRLKLSLAERIALLLEVYPTLSSALAESLLRSFAGYKVRQLCVYVERDPSYSSLIEGYSALAGHHGRV